MIGYNCSTVVEDTAYNYKVVGSSNRIEPFGPGRDKYVSSFLIINIGSTVVDDTPYEHALVGSNPTGCCAYFFFYPNISLMTAYHYCFFLKKWMLGILVAIYNGHFMQGLRLYAHQCYTCKPVAPRRPDWFPIQIQCRDSNLLNFSDKSWLGC